MNSRFARNFIPFAAFMGVIYVTIRSATWVRYEIKRNRVKTYSRDEMKAMGLDFTESKSIEEEYEEMVVKQNLNTWEQKRIERPWDEEPDRP